MMFSNATSFDGNDEIAPEWGNLGAADQRWVENRFEWLIETLGLERLWDASFVTPSERDFPDPYTGTESDATVLFSRVCGYLDLNVNRIKLGFFSSDDPVECELAGLDSDAAGLYEFDREKPSVWLNRTQLEDAESLVATISHELSHDILLGGGYLDPDEDTDHEEVTDLLTVFSGFGIFSANSSIRERNWHYGTIEYSETKKYGYLSMGVLSYSLALAAWYRNETEPDWLKALRPDVRDLVRRNLKRLITSQGLPERIPNPERPQIGDKVRQIAGADLDLPELIEPEVFETEDFEAVVKCICHKCHKSISYAIEFAGNTAQCPLCRALVDVPELAEGRRATLLSYQNMLGSEEHPNQLWARHNLDVKWRNYFIALGICLGIPAILISNKYIPMATSVPYLIGAFLSSWMTTWWHDLKALERGISPPSSWSTETD